MDAADNSGQKKSDDADDNFIEKIDEKDLVGLCDAVSMHAYKHVNVPCAHITKVPYLNACIY